MKNQDLGTALITGAGRRIGRAIALDLGRRGWSVAVHCRGSTDDAQAVAATIVEAGGRAAVFVADLACERQVADLVPAVGDRLGPVTLLVNNASVFERDEWDTASRDSWDRHLAVNLRAPFILIQAMARNLPAALTGLVVNIIDQRVWNLTPHFTSYTVSKAGLWTLTQTLAMALAPRIRVNAIGPGPTLPNERQTAQHFDLQSRSLPLGTGPGPDEICEAIIYYLQAKSVTGQMIAVDGGEHLGWAQPARGIVPVE